MFVLDSLLEELHYALTHLLVGQLHAEAELAEVLEEGVGPSRTAAHIVLCVGRGGDGARVDRRATRGVGHHLAVTIELADELHRLEFERAGEIVAKPGAQEILSYLKDQGLKLALATSSKVPRAEIILTNNRLRDFFNELTFSHEVKHGKPAPDIFLKAASKLGEKPGECVVFEDSEAGVRAAHAAGIPVICIPDLKQPSDEVRALVWRIEPSLLSALEFLRQS